MRPSFLFTLAYLTVSVIAGGYQGCIERVLLFYAYQIDELNDPKDRILGFACKKWDFMPVSPECKNNEWKECKGKGGRRCNFNELMASLGKARPNHKLVGPPGADQFTTTPDIDETSKVLYHHYTSMVKNMIVPNYPAYKAMKGADMDYNRYLERPGKLVNDAAMHKTEANKHLWEKYDSSLEKIKAARAGDHGRFLVPAAKADLGSKMEVVLEHLGSNPVKPSEVWETVDWAATEEKAKKDGVADYEDLIDKFKSTFYGTRVAREHLVVEETFKRMADTARSCR
ncbi:uncharacterized protein GIQ15_03401 [Arthroderma uncinatum]|uniref:uncharacterized protein n=1 Tax=Arthroderma uncinatum TaxID=74035 RepID=UPI00144A5647|nr:uncharacterized protein GIQ15_03401 [Arthroderma uncinatum]KAF3484077.1 hypothetical protein GIQ15_03401 [Arthroderma uncinatum]